MSDCSVLKTYANGESTEMEGALAMPLRMNRCPLPGSTPWRASIKVARRLLFPLSPMPPPRDPRRIRKPGEEIYCCSESSSATHRLRYIYQGSPETMTIHGL